MAEWYDYGLGYPIMGNERFQNENQIYKNMDQNMNYRGANPFANFNSGIGTFYNQRPNYYRQNVGTQPFPHTGFEEMEFDETVQAPEKKGFTFPSIWGGVKGGLEWLGDKFKRSPENQAFYESVTGGRSLPAGGFTKGDYGGKEYEIYNSPSGLKVGSDIIGWGEGYEKNMPGSSFFGSKTIEEMEQKKLDWFRDRVRKGKAISQRGHDLLAKYGDGQTRKDTTTTTTTEYPNVHGRNEAPAARHDYTRDRGGGYTLGGGFTGTRGQVGRTGSSAGVGRGHHSWRAEGGRVGYQDGELVEDEYMAEATPGGMMEENIEEVQGEPTREELEVIALEIFRLPLEELNEEQLNVVYQAAMEQQPAEEEVQFAAQEGPGEGIASLV